MPDIVRGFDNVDQTPKDLTDNGRCTGCGNCCSNVIPLTGADIARISNYVKKHNIKPINHVPSVLAGPSIDMLCPFYDEDRHPSEKCTIYDVRPNICRAFTCRCVSDEDVMRNVMMRFNDLNKGKDSKRQSMRQTFFGII